MTDQNLLLSPDLTLNLLSKSSPSQLQPFQFNRSRSSQPQLPTEAFYVSSQKVIVNNNNNNNNLKPSNLSHVPCKFFKQGTCTAGANCTFSHSSDLSSESAVCKYFVKGNCKFGTKCALLHTMSPYGTSSSSNSNGKHMNGGLNNNRLNMAGTPPPQPSLSFTGRRKTDQMISYSSSSNNNDHRSFLNDPFASSAPAVSLFHQFANGNNTGEQLWRNQTPRTNMISNDFIGLRSSPRESSDHLLGSSPFNNNNRQYLQQQQQQQQLSSSLRSNGGNGSGYFNSIPESGGSYRRQTSSYLTSGSIGNNNEDNYFNKQQQQNNGFDLNDAMLPSSLNDLFTPSELHVRKVKQQQEQQQYPTSSMSYNSTREISIPDSLPNLSSRDMAQQSSFETQNHQQWRVPFFTPKSQNDMMLMAGYEDRLVEGTAAINIPGGNNSGSSGTGSSGSYLHHHHEDNLLSSHDDEVQFFMEDDEAVTYDNTKDHKTLDMTIGNKPTNNNTSSYNFPSLISLPST